jgi:hypothetical protein
MSTTSPRLTPKDRLRRLHIDTSDSCPQISFNAFKRCSWTSPLSSPTHLALKNKLRPSNVDTSDTRCRIRSDFSRRSSSSPVAVSPPQPLPKNKLQKVDAGISDVSNQIDFNSLRRYSLTSLLSSPPDSYHLLPPQSLSKNGLQKLDTCTSDAYNQIDFNSSRRYSLTSLLSSPPDSYHLLPTSFLFSPSSLTLPVSCLYKPVVNQCPISSQRLDLDRLFFREKELFISFPGYPMEFHKCQSIYSDKKRRQGSGFFSTYDIRGKYVRCGPCKMYYWMYINLNPRSMKHI